MLFRTQVILTGRECVAKAEDQSQKKHRRSGIRGRKTSLVMTVLMRCSLQSVLVVTRRGSYGKLLLVTTPDRDGNAVGGEDVDPGE
ncbi:hypothetical protein T10_4133 [Trichinella papuae]|uniref:Uncharacterized protein n=1 Tax=Trichinella papuae TaxID=268474 RepID=A0A0V1N7U3_9BILA|nr:hypothetical protein T10_4133 [Trichinella papuae]